jgi:hypothetical protein
MRRRQLLTIALLAGLIAGCGDRPGPAAESHDGLVSLESGGAGATLILSGTLTSRSFTPQSMRIVTSRLASRASDPDEFRITLRDSAGRDLETIKTWSPLLSLDWDTEPDTERPREHATTSARRAVEIPLPVSVALEQVVLSWPGGKTVAHVDVGPEVRRFCRRSPQSPACRR